MTFNSTPLSANGWHLHVYAHCCDGDPLKRDVCGLISTGYRAEADTARSEREKKSRRMRMAMTHFAADMKSRG